ncbi:hypothetical protein, partial [Pseudomonas granadensis]|uniref:hypothetical protein n=1 Tax=Pseudomonas granadensis TaxID=1421430 RepID=UPI0019D31362
NLLNSLNLKEFSVSTAPEVGRIIDTSDLPSTVNFAFYEFLLHYPHYIETMLAVRPVAPVNRQPKAPPHSG